MTDTQPTLPKNSPKKGTNWVVIFFLLLLVGGAYIYFSIFKTNTPSEMPDNGMVNVPTGTQFNTLANMLKVKGLIEDETSFRWWAEQMDYHRVREGRFKIPAGVSDYQLIKFLQTGKQTPIKVVLNNERQMTQIAAKVGKLLESDSAAIIQVLRDTALMDSLGYTPQTLMAAFIPNTYEVFWNTTPRGFLERMVKESKRFWTPERLAKAKALNMTPSEVYTMASIVQGETNKMDEKPRVAGAYINRLKQNIKLQADPTVQFALLDAGKTTAFRRLLNVDYLFPHPYNTYLREGLPPGPIGMASIPDIDAVLNYEKHNYIFFCAKPDNSNYHNFSETYEGHLVNVRNYTNWLNSGKK